MANLGEVSRDFVERIPKLEGEAAAAVEYRGAHVQIIAGAGSGKTEVVSQRIATLLRDGQDPSSIVAFTFTEKAAEELKERIRWRVAALLGDAATEQLGRLYVGTIHAYCFRLLQTYVPQYETYTPLDANQMTNLLYREATRLGLKRFDPGVFKAVAAFQRSVDVVENELLPLEDLPAGDFKDALQKYYAMLDGYRFMSFGTQIILAVRALEDPEIRARVAFDVKHLIVDEYQDVNPAQEELIRLIAKPSGDADLVVVGDDDQSIYQFRGSNVDNIVHFSERYAGVATFNLLVNRRSRPDIVAVANQFAATIPGRLEKSMRPHRPKVGDAVSLAIGHEDEATEADAVAMDIEALHLSDVPYSAIAILVRGRTAYPRLLDALEASGIPVQPAGRMGLFQQPEAAVIGATFAWISEIAWAPGRFIKRDEIKLDYLLQQYAEVFGLDNADAEALRDHLEAWKIAANQETFGESLVRDFYTLVELLRVSSWELADATERNRLGTLARFTNVLADYESVTIRARRDPENVGEQVGGRSGGAWFYRNFALLLVNYANGNYDDFEGEEDLYAEGVTLDTVHGAKGLEWPVVLLPSLTKGRFPSTRTGRHQDWLLPRDLFDAARYEGDDADERRLFYVAMTRARDWVSLSSHLKVTSNAVQPSPYLLEVQEYAESGGLPTDAEPKGIELPELSVTYSDLESYATCPRSYLLRTELGFMPPVQAEIGYGNAVHHVMRALAEKTKATGKVPSPREVNDLLSSDFFLPFANKPAHREMRENARKLVFKYLVEHRNELLRTWATERPFELYLPGVVVRGRADVIYDEHDGVPSNLAIVDYKTAIGEAQPLQLQVYTDAGRREGLTVAAAFINDMATAQRHAVPVDEEAIAQAETFIKTTAEALKRRDFTPKPEIKKCRMCDVRAVCGARLS